MVTSHTLAVAMWTMMVAPTITSMVSIASIIILFISIDRLFISLLKIADASGKVCNACLNVLKELQLHSIFSL